MHTDVTGLGGLSVLFEQNRCGLIRIEGRTNVGNSRNNYKSLNDASVSHSGPRKIPCSGFDVGIAES
ncbi:hypothetical protein VTH06DRAFT_4130 [Thermothelomyces fergusii]